MNSSKMWDPKWVLIGLLWCCYTLNHADRQVLFTLFPALQKEFGFSNEMLGLTGALFLWIYGLVSPVSGVLGDRWPKPALVAGSLAIWSFFTVLSGLAPNGPALLVCRALLGISESLFMPAAYALMANAHGPETRSKAIAVFATSQMAGVALGGSLGGYITETFHWRAAFWLLGAAGMLFAWPLYGYLRGLPESIRISAAAAAPTRMSDFVKLLRIPSLVMVASFVAAVTFGIFLVYTWLPTFLYDKFALGLARAGVESSVYPQIGTVVGLLGGGALADALYRRNPAARFWLILTAFCCAAPCIYQLGAASTLGGMRMAAVAFGLFAGAIIGNQAAAAFDVVPPTVRATAVGVLNFVGCIVSGFAPYFGGVARDTFGVDRLMTFTGVLFVLTSGMILITVLRRFETDRARAMA